MSDNDFSEFGELLKILRMQRNINQQHLADKLAVHRNTISKWERGICLPESKTIVLELAHQLELDKNDTQRVLEASLTSSKPHWYVPFSNNPFFTGRESHLTYLHEALSQNTALRRSYALCGLGGIGKTQVAIEYAYQHSYDYTAILWISAENRESIVKSFIAIIDVLHLPVHSNHQDHAISAIQQWLNEHSEWLLIFDNVEDPGLVKSFLPATRSGSVLLTTRLQNLGSIAQVINLESMTRDEGCQFLLRRIGLAASNASETASAQEETQLAEEIVTLMDGLPLALDQAGAYIDTTQCSLRDYLRLYRLSQQRLLDERDAYADHAISVARTFTLAFEQLKVINLQAVELLTACAFLSPEMIPESFFRDGAKHLGQTFEQLTADPFQFNAAMKALQMYSLIKRDANTHTLTLHRLVQVVLKEQLSENMQNMWAARVIRAMNQLFPEDEKMQADYWLVSERLLPHALMCITLGERRCKEETAYISLMIRVATYLLERVHYIDAELFYKRALYAGEQLLSEEHPLIAECLYGLATLYFKQDKYTEAESFYLRSLFLRERAQETESLSMANALYGLATLYHRQGQYEKTEPLYLRALRIREQELGSEHFQVASLLNNLAELYREQGKQAEAELLYLRALRIWEKELGSEHPRISHPLSGLADLYREQNKYAEAELLYRRALQIWEKELGMNHSLVAGPLSGLAELYREQNKYAEAEPLYRRALQIRIRALGSGHPEVAETLCYLANFYQVTQQPMEALSLYQQALTIHERILGPHHPKTSTTRTNYVNIQQLLKIKPTFSSKC